MPATPVHATLVWFRLDLRLSDHPALHQAARRGPVIPVYIDEDASGSGRNGNEWAPGAASRWWLHHSLASLDADLRARGVRLILRRGDPLAVLRDLIRETGAEAVHWSRRYEPALDLRDRKIAQALRGDGVEVEAFASALLFEPESIRTQTGGPYQVFTPYWRACLAASEPLPPLPELERIQAPEAWPDSLDLRALDLLPHIAWAGGLAETWRPGSQGARALLGDRLDAGLNAGLRAYASDRDTPAAEGTSRQSPHLHFGEIGVREIWAAVQGRLDAGDGDAAGRASLLAYQRQLGWREFAHHLLVHFPRTPVEPLRSGFAAFPWRRDAAGLCAWQRGRTGYPYVDAGMRQLWATGWMHNRVRMAAASFLVKHLLIPWQDGARWFWDTLVDADLAQNTLGWQWVAGCGADAAPYFRIFNPVTQGERFDPEGAYIRRWVPELARLQGKWIHRPWEAPASALNAAGLVLGGDYPLPVVDHALARARALAAYQTFRD
ncbi:MAG: deoxyribodipyrimidine photo-lyase [Fibrobacteria bacterium]